MPAPGCDRLGGRFGGVGVEGGDPELDHASAAVAGRESEASMGSAVGVDWTGLRFEEGSEEHVFSASNEVSSLDA